MAETTYDRQWFWKKWLGERKGQRCRILARGKKNSCLVEFEDGYQTITSRYAVRRITTEDATWIATGQQVLENL